MKNKHVIIYMPNGDQHQFSTTDLGDSNINIAEKIECEPTIVNVVVKMDGKVNGYAYTGLPYLLSIW